MADPQNIQTFVNVDAAKWQRIKALILDKVGISIDSDTGTDKAKGIMLTWKYDPIALTLEVDLDSRSFYDPSAEQIDLDIDDTVTNA